MFACKEFGEVFVELRRCWTVSFSSCSRSLPAGGRREITYYPIA